MTFLLLVFSYYNCHPLVFLGLFEALGDFTGDLETLR